MAGQGIKVKLSKTTDIIIKVAAVIAAITAIGGGYSFFEKYLYKPTIRVVSIDFKNGVAVINWKGNNITIEGDATYSLNGQWGVRFGIKYVNGVAVYDRLDLVREGMVYKYLSSTEIN